MWLVACRPKTFAVQRNVNQNKFMDQETVGIRNNALKNILIKIDVGSKLICDILEIQDKVALI